MARGGTFRRLARAGRRALSLLARPVRVVAGRGPYVLRPYRGYGSQTEIFLIGRVFRQPTLGWKIDEGRISQELIDVGRGLVRRGVGGAKVLARFGGAEQAFETDRDGYFRVHMRPAVPPPADRLWHDIALELVRPIRVAATGRLFVPPADRHHHVVISDIDDTIMFTGVASKARMLWRLFMQGARSRVAFPGMAALLRALHRGPSGGDVNPMLYVSRGPWSIYDVLDEFFNLHSIPIGPLLFLREWGLTLQRPLPRRAKDHKLVLIRNMLDLYRDLPFVLIGDSGQRDPEIYAQIVREHPGRVLAVYIRKVEADAERDRAIEALATEIVAAGSSLLLAADSMAMAEHAAARGLIPAAAVAAVASEQAAPCAPGAAAPPPRQPAQPVGQAALRDALQQSGPPASLVVEADGAAAEEAREARR
jgi:phosphatidate phosphatase APP1